MKNESVVFKSAEEILFKHWQKWFLQIYECFEPPTLEQMKEDTSFEQVCIPAMEEYASQKDYEGLGIK